MSYSRIRVRSRILLPGRSPLGLTFGLANRQPARKALGHRPYDPITKTFGPYQWLDYQTVQRRKADFGIGLVELHEKAGITGSGYGVGLWCQNRPEWQITGM
jgi:long-chain acyl-CoA synthetase